MPKTLTATKHFNLAVKLRHRLRQMAPGEELPTFSNLGHEFDVSELTVSQALGRLRREGLVHRPAGRKRLVLSNIHDRALHRISFIRPDHPSMNYDALARAVVTAGKKENWAFNFFAYGQLEDLDLGRAVGDADAGVFMPYNEILPEHVLDTLRRPRKPVVVIHEPVKTERTSSVSIENRRVGQLAVEHLAQLGHRRILIVLDQPHDATTADRLAGWYDGMRNISDNGVNMDDLVVDCGCKIFQDAPAISYRFFSRWLNQSVRPGFTAVFCSSFAGVMAVTRALRESGVSVPDEVSVIGYADEGHFGEYLNPPLTAIEADMTQYGQAVIDLLKEVLASPAAEPKPVQIEPYLVERGTTARARGGMGRQGEIADC